MTAAVATATTLLPPASLPASLRRVVLIGFMGAGKTTVGRILAQSLAWNFLDLDHHLEARTGATIPQIFTLHGEPHFRRLESSALANALATRATVLALGGGTPEELTNRLLLEQTPGTHIVYLAAPFPVLYDRCMLQSFSSPAHQRPVLTTPAEAQARFDRRHPIYARLAHHTLATAHLEASAAAQAILTHLISPPDRHQNSPCNLPLLSLPNAGRHSERSEEPQ